MVNYYYMINYNIAIIVITYIRYNTRAPGGARARARAREIIFEAIWWGILGGSFSAIYAIFFEGYKSV